MIETARKLDFHEPTLEDVSWTFPILYNSQKNSCEYSFTTLFMWRGYYKNQIARADDTLFVRSANAETIYLLPVGGDLKSNIETLLEYQNQQGESLQLFGVSPAQMTVINEWFPDMFDWQASPADFDYVYNAEDLARLEGRKYHGKRNHIAAFEASYDWSYEAIDDSNTEEVIVLTKEWCRERGNCSDPGLRTERHAIKEALMHRDALHIRGGLLRVEGKVIAMTMGSPINKDTYDVHVEKALTDYDGAYAMINREFAQRELLGNYRYINRENDLGIEGLRRAKQSYRPVMLLEKYLGVQKR